VNPGQEAIAALQDPRGQCRIGVAVTFVAADVRLPGAPDSTWPSRISGFPWRQPQKLRTGGAITPCRVRRDGKIIFPEISYDKIGRHPRYWDITIVTVRRNDRK